MIQHGSVIPSPSPYSREGILSALSTADSAPDCLWGAALPHALTAGLVAGGFGGGSSRKSKAYTPVPFSQPHAREGERGPWPVGG
jgi:hypothetical protein